jgi:hypothetical protein
MVRAKALETGHTRTAIRLVPIATLTPIVSALRQ